MDSSLGAQLSRARSDLARIVREGPRERDWLPASTGLFLRGKRHLIAAPAKSGKSLATLAHAVEMALNGARVAILDRENGADEYARRLRAMLDARKLDAGQARLVSDLTAHYEWPPISLDARNDPSYVEHFAGIDLVVFDSSRAFLSALDLDEDSSNDYARFMAALVDPLHRAGIATLILDNSGHDGQRARGSSAKADLNEVVFRLTATQQFGEGQQGALKLDRTHSRFGGSASSWHMAIGDGVYGPWTAAPRADSRDTSELHDALVSILADTAGGIGADALLSAARKLDITVGRSSDARKLLAQWVSDPTSPLVRDASGYRLGTPVRDVADEGGRVIDLSTARSQ